MPVPPLTRRLLLASWGAAAAAVLAGAGGLALWRTLPPPPEPPRGPMLLAPMVGVIEPCILARDGDAGGWVPGCTGPQGSAAALLESTLRTLQPQDGPYPLGYTLPVPLLNLFQAAGTDWTLDTQQVERLVRTIADSPRPLVLYLFSTHFATGAPIEAALQRDPANLAVTRDGPLPQDHYTDGSVIHNWSFARTDNAITQRREQAITAVLGALCRLDAPQRARVRGITLLGELHHLFPHFETGMGFEPPYRVSDTSPASVQDFRTFLRQRFASVAALNRALDSDYASFDAVEPPTKDIRSEPLTRYADHIDSFAHGTLPVAGWLHAPGGPHWVRIYRNGGFVARTRVSLNRQDVLAARPAFGDANVGWRWDMDFHRLPVGLHRIDILLERAEGPPALLATRQIAIMDKRQRTPAPAAQEPLPAHVPAPPGVEFYVDQPHEQAAYYYNPLVPLWHAFREQQVLRYLRHFDALVARSCMAATPRYTHQILPFGNPSWDAHKFAIDVSLQPGSGLQLGVSLYGETSYGDSFAQWHARHGGAPYGITEFHPLRAMTPQALGQVLDRHAQHGARFLSFFLEPRWQGAVVPRTHNPFSLDPDNQGFGSDVLYRSLQQTLADAPAPAGR